MLFFLITANWQSNWLFYKRGGLGNIEGLHLVNQFPNHAMVIIIIGKVNSAYEPSGSSGRSLSRFQ